jgi:toxin ParE1/3/4
VSVAPFYRPQFRHDLVEELNWLEAKAGAETAERWYEALHSTIAQLQKHPGLGRKRPDLKPQGIRSWRIEGFARWLVFYLERDDTLIFLRVRQGTMNLGVLKMDG